MASRRLNLDRISNLPDTLLCHILSFLSTKEAVATSIISKRWRFLWTWLTNLDFDEAKLGDSKRIFPNIVYRFLLLRRHDTPIKRFRLKWSCGFPSFDLDSWARATIAGEVKEIVLETRAWGSIPLPPSIFSHKALVILKLSGFQDLIDVPSSAHFPNLKTLHLERIQFKDLDSARNLFSTCPVLEELTLFVLLISKDEILQDVRSSQHTLRLNTPAVKYLSLEDHVSQHIHFGNMDSLVKATISHLPCDTNHCRDQLNFLEAVRNATDLVFPSHAMKPFCNIKSFNKFPEFHNVVNLKITQFGDFWGLLRRALHNLPRLEHLILEKEPNIDAMPKEASWTPPQQPLRVPNCLTFLLTTFCLLNFEGLEEEMKFVDYILENSMFLKMVTLSSLELETETRLSIFQKLAMFKRGSKNCQVKFD